ncbi:hypothetical protein OU798_07600 [Prolixibacteraceae bacterium Z1-6]|uniref:Uncharacterized protein n=1 Tax=Draconibacterium aestuarii TaxID=2998507 RepID=A0A9X3F5L1_9BACT|nr:hypothetical protein [Prolixibacteraceae bacterium Z1-6]
MKSERPILFSTPMVQAILDGSKTQTRRTNGIKQVNDNPSINDYKGAAGNDPRIHEFSRISVGARILTIKEKCPYGQPGDLLWVREKFAISGLMWQAKPSLAIKYCSDNAVKYAASDNDWQHAWRPSIHMPKAAARIWLQVEEISVERLQDISEEDAKAEGIKISYAFGENEEHFYVYPPKEKGKGIFCGPCRVDDTWVSKSSAFGSKAPAKFSFASLWSSVNGIGSWEQNPWLWVVKFKVLSTTGKPETL